MICAVRPHCSQHQSNENAKNTKYKKNLQLIEGYLMKISSKHGKLDDFKVVVELL